ncbi:kelch-like protein 8 [Tetranychus urticae]|uniref:kelch-like protein 8 n=1 Tax=Tetranychus urticae TaxID=32264 RepID=UPI00077B91FA|nr:kelch-like protein 8 [Tetranychus urticae]
MSTSSTSVKGLRVIRRPGITLDHLHQSKEWADLEVHLGSKVYQIHRNIVCTAIPYFKTMMSTNLIETQSNVITINYPHIDCDAFEWLLNWSYSISQQISLSNAKSLLVASDYFQVNSVFQFCCDYLDGVIAVDNVLDIKQWIGTFNVGNLRDKVNKFIAQNFNSIVLTPSFVNQTLEQVTEIITDNNLNVSNEIDVFEAIIRWTKYKHTERNLCTPKLLIHLRWCQLSYDQIINQISKHEIVTSNEDCRQIIIDVLSCLTFESSYNQHSSTWKQPRCQLIKSDTESTDLIVACLASPSTFELSFLDHSTNTFISWLKVNQPLIRENHKAAILGSSLLLIARDCISLNLINGRVYPCPKELRIFDWPDLASGNDCVYVSGGLNGKPSDIVYKISRFDDESFDIIQLPRLKNSRAGHRLIMCDNSLYVIGGRDESNILDSVERFDSEQNKWQIVTPMVTARSAHGVAVHGDRIFVAGGYDGSSFLTDVEEYNPKLDKWIPMTPLIVKGKIVSLIAHQEKLFTFIRSPAKLVQIYDFISKTWSVTEADSLTDDSLIAVTQIPSNFCQKTDEK